ncbi:MAG: J domain-containing protein [Actinomycetota bacterium]|nr:J domain-containing protein [Actinomycetota bacterium]
MAGRHLTDPHEVLGVEPGTTWDEVCLVRRRLVKALHPDLHQGAGRADAERRMAAVNRAFDQLRAVRDRASPIHPPDETDETTEADEAEGEETATSFSIDVLPVVAFETVLLAAVEIGDVVQVEEPYLLGVLVDHPGPCQCLIEMAPEAGGTLVTIDVAPRAWGDCPAGSAVRDALVGRGPAPGPALVLAGFGLPCFISARPPDSWPDGALRPRARGSGGRGVDRRGTSSEPGGSRHDCRADGARSAWPHRQP